MPVAAESYTPINLQKQLRSQAFFVWAVVLLFSALWSMLIIAAPVFAGNSLESLSHPIYNFFSYICHQKIERSIHILGHPFAVCSRCFGVYFGIVVGILAYPVWRQIDEIEPLPRFWLFLALIPIGIDWTLGVAGIWDNNHVSRLLTGLVLGFACATYIIPAVVEITRNLSGKRASNIR